MKRDFEKWLSDFRDSISDYHYYVNFNNVYRNADKYKVELNILNSLIGSKNIEEDFNKLIEDYPSVLHAIPILIAKRESEIYCIDTKGSFTYNFKNKTLSTKQYIYFMEQTGLFELISNHLVSNLYDYVLGVNTGLDSNGRKNRGGHLMENLVESFIKDAKLEYYKEMTSGDVEDKFGIDLSSLSNNGTTTKRFDFVIKGETTVYGVECNFYNGNGSKQSETARSYKMIAKEAKNIDNFKFVWFTDGRKGWLPAKNNLKETFDVLDELYNIKELECGILKEIIK